MARAKWWKCRKQSGGVKCGAMNPSRKRLCQTCGKPKPARRKPAHMVALDESYEAYLALNGGIERCAICDREPGSRRLDRDHDHKTGRPRGLLCARCNRALANHITPQWLRKATYYLERT